MDAWSSLLSLGLLGLNISSLDSSFISIFTLLPEELPSSGVFSVISLYIRFN